MLKKDVVRLDEAERAFLADLVSTGAAAARTLTHARVLLKADQGPGGPGWTDEQIAEALEVGRRTVERVRAALVEEGLDAALRRRRPPARPRTLDGAGEARLVALACSAPPAGRERWALRLPANRRAGLEVVDGIAPNTARAVLKQTRSSPG